MAKTVVMPQMGYDMDAGTLLRWLKNVGDPVERGEAIAEIETDKVNIEIEAFESGVLRQTLITEGQTVPVGEAIAIIGDPNEQIEEDGAAGQTADAATVAESQTSDAGAAAINAESPVAGAQQGASLEGAVAPPLETQGQPARAEDGMVQQAQMETQTEAPVPAPVGYGGADSGALTPQVEQREPGERIRASPLVRRIAAEHGIDLSQVQGSGPHGRIVKRDIEPYMTGARPQPQAPAAPTEQPAAPQAQPEPVAAQGPQPAAPVPGELVELSRIRQTIGKRMSQSFQQAPHFYVTMAIDMTKAMQLREQINADLEKETQISINDLIVKATALTLRKYPVLNSAYADGKMQTHQNIDVGIAVATETGLISPFISETDRKSLGEIARMSKDLVSRARSGGLKPEEYAGGTFTISNLGMYGVDDFIAIINPPQAAILAVGSVQTEPVWNADKREFEPRQMMKVTMSADHRLTDGAEVARYLQDLKKLLEAPMQLLVG